MDCTEPLYQYILKILSAKKVEPLWPFLGLYVCPTSEIHEILKEHVGGLIGYMPSQPWTAENQTLLLKERKDFSLKTIETLFAELNTIRQAHFVLVGDAVRGWIEIEFIPMIELEEKEPWLGKWKSMVYKIGNRDRLEQFFPPQFLSNEKSEELVVLAEELVRRENLLGRMWADVNMDDGHDWDKVIEERIESEAIFGDPLGPIDDYMVLKNFLDLWPKIYKLFDGAEMLLLNEFVLESIKADYSCDTLLEFLENDPNFLNKYSIPQKWLNK